jgi:DNA repair exonuclease SbcCD ATPase subunit
MQVEIQNFRCWKKHTVQFNDKGIILINGTSGSGKSSILNSIYFAITGNGNKIVTYGEKKCSVKINFNEGIIEEIKRTKGPCRLTVKLRENDILLEDEEGQKVIESVYGTNFQQTSYMTQKMIHSFLGFSATEKMNFLQKIISEECLHTPMGQNTTNNNNINEVKKKCKDKISELKKQSIEIKSKLNLYESEIEIKEKELISFLPYGVLRTENYDKNNTSFEKIILNYFTSDKFKNEKYKFINYDKNLLKTLRQESIENLDIYNKFKSNKIKEQEYLRNKKEIVDEIEEYHYKKIELENKLNYNKYEGDSYYNFLIEKKEELNKKKELIEYVNKLKNEENNLELFIKEQILFFQKEKEKYQLKLDSNFLHLLNNECQINIDIQYLNENIEKWKKSTQTVIEFLNFLKENEKKKEKYSINVENEIVILKDKLLILKDEHKEKQNKINDIKQEWKLKNQIHKCPKCNVSLRFITENNKNTIKVENNTDITDPSLYKEILNKLQIEENNLNKEIDIIQKNIFELENLKNDIINYNNKRDNFTKRISRADPHLLKYIKFSLENYSIKEESSTTMVSNIQNRINNLIKFIEDDIKYKKEIEELDNKINNTDKNETDNPTILQKIKIIKQIKKEIEKISKTLKINLNEVIIDEGPSSLNIENEEFTNEKINETLIEQTKLKQEYDNNKEQLEQVKTKWIKLNLKLKEVNNLLIEICDFLKENEDIENKYKNSEKELNRYYKLEEEYNNYININKIYEDWNRLYNEKRVQKYLFENVSNDIVVHETFLGKINESESILLTNSIDVINYYINDYLEKFFPNDPIIVDIVPYKENKKGKENIEIKPGINIKVFYKGEEIELTSLSGGEYDRVSLSIMLAFNNICKSDIILLDESISSLDAELTSDILEKLKENLTNKRIIVVAHQISTGMFDQIINTK